MTPKFDNELMFGLQYRTIIPNIDICHRDGDLVKRKYDERL